MKIGVFNIAEFVTKEPPALYFAFETPPESVKFCEMDECEIVRFTATRCIIRHVITTEIGDKIVFWEKAECRTVGDVFKVGKPLKYTGWVYID